MKCRVIPHLLMVKAHVGRSVPTQGTAIAVRHWALLGFPIGAQESANDLQVARGISP